MSPPALTGEPGNASASSLRSIGRALRNRNYRLFFAGQSVSMIGTWLTRVATSWLVYRLTGSALLLGIVGFAGQIPTFFLAPLAGVWVDRWSRHRVLVVTQALAMLQSAALAALAWSSRMTVVHIAALSVVQGLINAFDMPARQAFVVEMVADRDDLPNAIALNSSMVNAARLIGPSVAGMLIAAGRGGVVLRHRRGQLPGGDRVAAGHANHGPPAGPAHDPGAGPSWPKASATWSAILPIRSVLLLLALVSLMGMPYTVLMPVVATQVLHGRAHTLGFLMAASGAGALTGALYLASRTSVVGLGRVIAIAAAVFGVGLLRFRLSRVLWLSLILMVPTGMGMMVQMAASNTVLQTIVDEDKRGRVMSFYAMAFFGTVPFGSLLAGSLADKVGATNTIGIGGIACVVGAALFFRALPELRRLARPTYVRLGILPEIAGGLRSTSPLPVTPDE